MRSSVLVVVLVVSWCGLASADPSAIVVVVDRSMTSEKLALVGEGIAAAKLAAGDQIGVVAFGRGAQVVVPLQQKRAAVAIRREDGGANVVAGLDAARELLAKAATKRRLAIVVTDGGSLIGVAAAVERLRAVGVVVAAVGVQSLNERTLAAIASAGEGGHARVEDAAGLTQMIGGEVERVRQHDVATRAFVFVLDRGHSMRGGRLANAKRVVRAAVQRLAPDDLVGIVTFESDVEVLVGLQRVGDAANRALVVAAVDRVKPAVGTELFGAMRIAMRVAAHAAAASRHVIVITDGDGTEPVGFDQLGSDMQAAGIEIAVVGVEGADRKVLDAVAQGGRVLVVEKHAADVARDLVRR